MMSRITSILVLFIMSGSISCASVESKKVAYQYENSFAVVIGIENYRIIPKAEFAANDARVIYESLTKQMGYPKKNVLILMNEKSTKGDIERALEGWLKNQVDKDSRVFIYYAGHGAPDPPSGEAYIVPYDGDLSYIEKTAYPLKRLNKTLSELPTRNVVVVIDSCFSGAGGRSMIAKGARPLLITKETPFVEQTNAIIFSATQRNQITTSYPDVQHGLFTYFFLKGLQGEADEDKDGNVDVKEVFAYLKPRVQNQAKRQNVEQVPDLYPAPGVLGTRADMRLMVNLPMIPKIEIEGGGEPKKEIPMPPPGF